MPAKVTGLRETVKALEDLGVEVADLKSVMGDIAAKAADVMAPFIPSRKGTLRASARPSKAKGKAVVTVGRARVPYAGPINYGWRRRHIAPANFTGRTDRVMEGQAEQMLEDGIKKLISEKGLAK